MVEDKHVHFGLAIKNAWLDCDLTQEALAERVGISCCYLIAIENEGRIPKLPTVYRLIHSMHISSDRIFTLNSHRKILSVRSLSTCWNPALTGMSISFFVLPGLCCRSNKESRLLVRVLSELWVSY